MKSSSRDAPDNSEAEFERLRREERDAFLRARTVENYYGRRLRMLAKHIGDVIRDFHINEHSSPGDLALLEQWLNRYADVIDPWARSVAKRFVYECGQRDKQAWRRVTKAVQRGLREEIENADVGKVFREELANQVQLIKSIPLEAAMRVHEIAVGNIYGGEPFIDLVDHIMDTGNVSKSRATLIARTESARVTGLLTATRAQAAGVTHFIWRVQNDKDVRPTHRRMANKVCSFAPPPEVEPGKRYLPGGIYNCFTGDTEVSLAQGCRRIFRAAYNGKFSIICTPSDTFRVTPNHPILTRRGWLPANQIERGDYLITVQNRLIGEECSRVSFEDLFSSFGINATTLRNGLVDFHGDRIVNDNVDVVALDDLLPGNTEPCLFQSISDFAFAHPDRRVICCWIEEGQLRVGDALTSGISNEITSRLEREFKKSFAVGLQCVSDRYASAINYCYDRSPAALTPPGQLQDRHSFKVFLNDEVFRKVCSAVVRFTGPRYFNPQTPELFAKNVRGMPRFMGNVLESAAGPYIFHRVQDNLVTYGSAYVYTLETTSGYYGIGRENIASKNCRCYIDPIIQGWRD